MKNEFDTPEYRDLERTRTIPMSRAQRRAIAKRAGVRFIVVNQGMRKQPPVYLGIKQFKKAAGADKKLATEYKENAHLSLKELRERRALEAAEIREGKTIPDKTMEKLNDGDDKLKKSVDIRKTVAYSRECCSSAAEKTI